MVFPPDFMEIYSSYSNLILVTKGEASPLSISIHRLNRFSLAAMDSIIFNLYSERSEH